MNIRVFVGKKDLSSCSTRVALFISLVKKEVPLTEPCLFFLVFFMERKKSDLLFFSLDNVLFQLLFALVEFCQHACTFENGVPGLFSQPEMQSVV
jgi:hypothetical protein